MSAKRFTTVGRLSGYVAGLLVASGLLLTAHQVSTAHQPTSPQPKAEAPEVPQVPQVPQVPADSQPHVIKAQPMGSQPLGPDGQPDCHGPLYYKLKKDDELKKQLDSNRQEFTKFTYEVQEILVRKQNEERGQLMAEKLAYTKRCAAAKEQPSFLCAAYSKRSLETCFLLPDGLDAIFCRVMLGLDLGKEAAFPPAAPGAAKDARVQTDDLAVSMLLEGAGTGKLACPDQLPAELDTMCRQAAAVVEKGGDAAAAPQVQLLAGWVMALYKRDSQLCRKIPKPEHAEFCAAYIDKDLTLCRTKRPLLDYVDQDWSCRSTLLATRLYPIKNGSEVVLTLGSPYEGTGDCTISMVVEYGGTQNRRDVKTLQLKSGDVTEVRIPLAGEKFLRAEPNCKWSDKDWGVPVLAK